MLCLKKFWFGSEVKLNSVPSPDDLRSMSGHNKLNPNQTQAYGMLCEVIVSRFLGNGEGALLSGIYIEVLHPTILKRWSTTITYGKFP
jgi:hypothetical protein